MSHNKRERQQRRECPEQSEREHKVEIYEKCSYTRLLKIMCAFSLFLCWLANGLLTPSPDLFPEHHSYLHAIDVTHNYSISCMQLPLRLFHVDYLELIVIN
jgi:hypothetical protein